MGVTRDEWDETCGLWRWPEGENYVVLEWANAYFVIDEVSRKVSFWAKELIPLVGVGDNGLAVQALRAYLDRERDEPKPWLEAKPEEIWALDTAGEGEFHAWSVAPEMGGSHFVLVGGLSNIPLGYPDIAAGRRIWPEVD